VFVLFVLALLTGCFFPDIEAVYKPPKQYTLIVVDDSSGSFIDQGLLRRIGNQIRHDLVNNDVVPAVVPFGELDVLKERLGEDYHTTSLLALGKRTGAQQVLHVSIISAQIRSEPGLLRPEAVTEVKLIDVTNSKRLWPTGSGDGRGNAAPFVLSSDMFYRLNEQDNSRSRSTEVAQRFATIIGEDVAKLFYKHPQDVGGSYDRDN